jgi:cysteine desulfurase
MQQVASLIGADPKEIIFTRLAPARPAHEAAPAFPAPALLMAGWPTDGLSGATESNNLAIKGVANFYKSKKNHVVTVQTVCPPARACAMKCAGAGSTHAGCGPQEHKCVLDSCRVLQQQGFEVTYLPVQKNGLLDLEELRACLRPETALVSVMMASRGKGGRGAAALAQR